MLSTFRLHLHGRSWHGSQAMWTTKNLVGRCAPPFRNLRHAIGWRGWRITMHHCQCTPWLISTTSCHLKMQDSPPRRSVLANCSIVLLMQEFCSIGLRRCIPQSPANLVIWQGVYRNSGGQWSCLSLSKRESFYDHSTFQLDRSNLTMANRDHATKIPEELHLKQQGPPENIHICYPQWRPACYYSHVGHCNSGGTSYYTMGV